LLGQIVAKPRSKFKASFTFINYHLTFTHLPMSKIYEKLLRPLLFHFSTETAHEFGIETLKILLESEKARHYAHRKFSCDEFGELKRFGLTFKNPLGVAAGFDKNARAIQQRRRRANH